MGNYELSYDNDREILEYIKKIILNRHPIVDDRTHVLYPSFNEPRTPEMEIDFRFYKIDDKDITRISFMDGTYNYKTSIPDEIEVNGLISKKMICEFISYLLTDHDLFKDFYKNDTWIELPMIVDGCSKNMHGISCGEIDLKFDFGYHPDKQILLNEYLRVIITTFYDKLKRTSAFEKEFSDYCDFVKNEFINSLTIEQLKEFIDLLNSNDLCNLIYAIPNDRFAQLYDKYNNREDIKKLIKI